MSKLLMIMRHAKSSWKDTSLSDHDRPLNGRGRRDAPGMANFLRQRRQSPDWILTSTAARARATAECMQACTDPAPGLTTDRRLYHAGPESFGQVLSEADEHHQCILLVSHNPGIEHWVYSLTECFESMPTASIAIVELKGLEWSEFYRPQHGTLLDVWRPKEVLDHYA